ncbi:MAG: hypothetical protein KBS59_07655 [Clostridiales bacterium]|nr:hypothetical protein [Clostridiales bacterium]
MKVNELVEKLGLKTLCLPDPERQVSGAYAGDLLSWVMGRAKADSVWATIMTNINVVAVASLADTSLTVICENSEVSPEIIETAAQKGVNLVRSELPIYELCVELSKLI